MDLKNTIITETIKLFSLNGYSGTSVKDIIEAAGTSKGGLYNHFSSKEDLFYSVLEAARGIWREKNLAGINEIQSPVEKVLRLLDNFKSRYLMDAEDFPGGCIFITFSAELSHRYPHLAKEVDRGFVSLKVMIRRWLDQGKETKELKPEVDVDQAAEIIFSGMLGATVLYGLEKSQEGLAHSIDCLMSYLQELRS